MKLVIALGIVFCTGTLMAQETRAEKDQRVLEQVRNVKVQTVPQDGISPAKKAMLKKKKAEQSRRVGKKISLERKLKAAKLEKK